MKKYTLEQIMQYIESQIKETHDDLKKCYIEELGKEKAKVAFETFKWIASIYVDPRDHFIMGLVSKHNRSFVYGSIREDLGGKYVSNLQRRNILTNDFFSDEERKKTCNDVAKEMRKKEKMTAKESMEA